MYNFCIKWIPFLKYSKQLNKIYFVKFIKEERREEKKREKKRKKKRKEKRKKERRKEKKHKYCV